MTSAPGALPPAVALVRQRSADERQARVRADSERELAEAEAAAAAEQLAAVRAEKQHLVQQPSWLGASVLLGPTTGTPPLWQTTRVAGGPFRCPIELPAALASAAEEKLGETQAVRIAGLVALRARLAAPTAPTLPRTDDMFLLAFLRRHKYDVARAHDSLLKYTELMAEMEAEDPLVRAEGGIDTQSVGWTYRLGLLQLLPGCSQNTGSRLAVVRGALFTASLLELLDASSLAHMLLWMFSRLLSDPWVTVNGLTMAEDLREMPLMDGIHFFRGMESRARSRVLRLLECIPVRFEAFYLLHAPSSLRPLLAMTRPFLSASFREKMVLASSLPRAAPRIAGMDTEQAAVAALLGSAQLPHDFGGSLESGGNSGREHGSFLAGTQSYSDVPCWFTATTNATGATGSSRAKTVSDSLGILPAAELGMPRVVH